MIESLVIGVMLPIALMIGAGVALDRMHRLDLPTLGKLNFWIFVPALAMVKLLETPLDAQQTGMIVTFGVVQFIILAVLAAAFAWLPALRDHRPLAVLTTTGYNIGNYGIPFVELAFGGQWLGLVIILLLVQNIATFLIGPPLLSSGRSLRSVVVALFKVPVVWAIAIAVLVRLTGCEVPKPGMDALRYLGNGLVPVALLTLGVQLARTPILTGGSALVWLVALRLLLGTGVTFLLALVMGFDAETTAVLVACGGLPVAVNVFILCSEYRRDEALAAQTILWTTILSTLFLPIVLWLIR